MKKQPELQWGETPFHRMNHDELLKVAIKMYDACVSAKSVLKMNAYKAEERGDIFNTVGSGAIAREKCSQVVDPIEKQYSSENIWRAFYRPAIDLLWKDNGNIKIRTNWVVCPVCGDMIGNSKIGTPKSNIGKRCGEISLNRECQGIMRVFTWADIELEMKQEDPTPPGKMRLWLKPLAEAIKKLTPPVDDAFVRRYVQAPEVSDQAVFHREVTFFFDPRKQEWYTLV